MCVGEREISYWSRPAVFLGDVHAAPHITPFASLLGGDLEWRAGCSCARQRQHRLRRLTGEMWDREEPGELVTVMIDTLLSL